MIRKLENIFTFKKIIYIMLLEKYKRKWVKEMEYQKFIPEGWENICKPITPIELNRAFYNGEIMNGVVTKCDSNYNLYVDLGNQIQGIIPREEVEAINIDETGFPKPNICVNKVNKIVQFKVKDIKNEDVVILSRKAVGKEALNWVKEELKDGMVICGIIKNIRPYGVFVEIGGGIVGLLHIEDISIARIKTPAERFKIGQKINVMVKYIDRSKERVILTYKELLGTWEENIKDFSEGDTVKGIAREIEKQKNGIFVELRPNLVGLADYQENIEYGQHVNVNIRKIIPEKKKVKLIFV